MQAIQAIFLGIVQGLTEFIPVSSSGHLELIPALLGWTEVSTIFILFAHLGTLIALLAYFRTDLRQLFTLVIKNFAGKLDHNEQQEWRTWQKVAIATIPAGLAGLLLENLIDQFYSQELSAFVTSFAMIIIGVTFLITEKLLKNKKHDLKKLSWSAAGIIVLYQIFALLRGVSRSGATILSGILLGLDRVSAARFSFMMSIPLITATSIYGVYKLAQLSETDLRLELVPGLLTMVTAAIFGFLAIRFLLGFLSQHTLRVFGWYRIIFGFCAIIILFA